MQKDKGESKIRLSRFYMKRKTDNKLEILSTTIVK